MPNVTSQADIVLDWRGLIDAVYRTPGLLPLVEQEHADLSQAVVELESVKARQEELNALRQEATQQLGAVIARGREIAIQIRSVARGKLGPRSERLVHFRVAPIRSRTRKLPPKPLVKLPDEEASGIEPGASVSPSTEPVV
jgi:hypothetical protein